jgi:hypothetical protein
LRHGDRRRRVEQLTASTQRRAGDDQREQVARCSCDCVKTCLDAVKQGVLKEKIIDRVGGYPQLGENHDGDFFGVSAPDQPQRLVEIELGIADRHPGNTSRNPDELMAIGREKFIHSLVDRCAQFSFGREALDGRGDCFLMA